MSAEINSDHRETLELIVRDPTSGNLEWRRVRSLLEALGAVTEEHNGKLKVTLGGQTEVLRAPRAKDVDKQLVVDLRRMLRQAGIAPAD